jgi:hypothetical protein
MYMPMKSWKTLGVLSALKANVRPTLCIEQYLKAYELIRLGGVDNTV